MTDPATQSLRGGKQYQTGSLSGNSGKIEVHSLSDEDRRALANIREVYFTRDVANTKRILKADMQEYVDTGDISRMKLVVLDELIPYFLSSICNVYDTPPLYKFDDKYRKEDLESFNNLVKEVELNRFLPETLERCRFHNTIIAQIRYFKGLDKVYLTNDWHAGSCIVETYEDFDREMRKLSYLQKGNDKTRYRIYWELLELNDDGSAKTLHYKIKLGKNEEVPKDDTANREPIGENKDINGPPYWPFITYRYSERGQGYWGNAMDSIVELVRVINILLTVTSDDTIQETIRILLLNFTPDGTHGENDQLKTGLRHPLMPTDQIGKDKMDAQILSADLYNTEVLELVNGLWSVVSNTHNVGNVLKPDFKQAVSALALRVQQEPLLRDWEADINIVTPLDQQLIIKLVEVNNYHRKEKKDKIVDKKILETLLVEYQEPHVISDEAGEYADEKEKWPDGTSSPLLYVMRKNPEMSEQEARDYITQNIKDGNDLLGLSFEVDDKDVDKNLNPKPDATDGD
jgi:hypothetical protein